MTVMVDIVAAIWRRQRSEAVVVVKGSCERWISCELGVSRLKWALLWHGREKEYGWN